MRALKRDRRRFRVGTTKQGFDWLEYLEVTTVCLAFFGAICTLIGLLA